MASIDTISPDGTRVPKDVRRAPKGSRYRVRYRTPDGASRTKTFDRLPDARAFITTVEHDILTGSYVDRSKGRTLLGDYFVEWARRQPWRSSSRASVESMFTNHVLPTFARRPLGSIRRGDVESWAAGLTLSGQTARLAVQYLGAMLESAVADGLIATNPTRHAKRPRFEAVPVVPLTPEELEALEAAAPSWFRVTFVLGAMCGLRQGEACGLTVDRIDFLRRTLTVDRQLLTPPAGEPGFGPPKTPRSYRTVPLAEVAVARLAAHVEAFGVGSEGLIVHEDGGPVRRQRFGHLWRTLRKQAGLEAVRFHDTRHTYASVLLSGGVSVAAAADYLGNTPAVLLKTYAHLMPADHDRARGVVESAFGSASRVTAVS